LPVESLGEIGFYWAISSRGDRLVYQDNIENKDIWRIDLTGKKGITRVLSSSAADINPQISPDGTQVAFVSSREKGWRVWVSDAPGSHPIALAPIVGRRPGVARWSFDGKQIVFECRNESNNDICVAPSFGGAVRRLTHNPARDALPSWSIDGIWVYVTSNRSGSFQIWKVPSDGTESRAVQLTKNGGYGALEGADGYVYFSRDPMFSGIWRVPTGGGVETQFGNFRNLGQAFCFAVGREGIYYTSSRAPDSSFELWLCRFSTGVSERITRINKRLYNGLSVSPDDRWLLVAAAEPGSGDLHMVENFR
jgi:Tol biopolymer transport system component